MDTALNTLTNTRPARAPSFGVVSSERPCRTLNLCGDRAWQAEGSVSHVAWVLARKLHALARRLFCIFLPQGRGYPSTASALHYPFRTARRLLLLLSPNSSHWRVVLLLLFEQLNTCAAVAETQVKLGSGIRHDTTVFVYKRTPSDKGLILPRPLPVAHTIYWGSGSYL